MNDKIQTYNQLLSHLPDPPVEELDPLIRRAVAAKADAVIVLDDDPTGTQTVYDVPVLTRWDTEAIEAELEYGTPLFYILTNSRSLTEEKAEKLGEEVGRNIRLATRKMDKKWMVVSRSDSTLRGHYPAEVKALERGLGLAGGVHFLIPAFFEGGRFTIDDVHYVRSGNRMIPAAQTPFAEDKVFGYHSSDLKEWVAEKTCGATPASAVKSIGLLELRTQSLPDLVARINAFRPGDVCIVNAAAYADLKRAALAILQSNIRPVFRTAAAWVAVLAARPSRVLLTAGDLNLPEKRGGLIVVGSYVPKSTGQLQHLQQHVPLESIELDVEKLLTGVLPPPSDVARTIDDQLNRGENVLLFTGRRLVSAASPERNLEIGKKVSAYLTDIVSGITVRPRYLLAKGGITSSDVATAGLRVERALVRGQILPGVPVWELGAESAFPGLAYIVFPGNVGEEDSLTEVVKKTG